MKLEKINERKIGCCIEFSFSGILNYYDPVKKTNLREVANVI